MGLPPGLGRVARVVLAAQAAIGKRLSPELRDYVREIAEAPARQGR